MTGDHIIANLQLVDPDGCIEVCECEHGGWRATLYRAGVACGMANGSETDRAEIYRLATKRLAPENLRRYMTRRYAVEIGGLPDMEFQA